MKPTNIKSGLSDRPGISRSHRVSKIYGYISVFIFAVAGFYAQGVSAQALNDKNFGLSLSVPQYLSDAELSARLWATRDTGATWIRFAVNWCEIQPDGPGTAFDWSQIDRVVSFANACGLKILPHTMCPPSWASGVYNDPDYWRHPPNEQSMWHWGYFHAEFVRRYSPQGVKVIEIWNEPNIKAFFLPQPNAAKYGQMLAYAHDFIKEADPGVSVISGGLAVGEPDDPDPVDFLNLLYYYHHLKYYSDAIGWHPYSLPNLPVASQPGWTKMATGARNVMNWFGDGNKPIWATEFGFASYDPATPPYVTPWATEQTQEMAVSQAIQLWKSYSWAGAFMYFNLVDGQDAQGPGFFGYVGLNRSNWSRKPAWYTFRSLVIPYQRSNGVDGGVH